MITIKTDRRCKDGRINLKIAQSTPHTTILLGIEALIEALLEEVPTQNIDDLLEDLRRIYIRDNGGNND